jgi:hypothetical protein
MRLYYTGAPEHQATQGSTISSLGGYISNTPVASGSVGSLFPDISQSEIYNKGRRVILVALKNSTGATVTDTKVYYTQENESLYTIQMGLITPAESCGEPVFEIVTKDSSLPIGVAFTTNKGIDNAINIPSLSSDKYVGIWIKIEISEEAKANYLSCDSLYEALLDESSPLNKSTFPFDLHISY